MMRATIAQIVPALLESLFELIGGVISLCEIVVLLLLLCAVGNALVFGVRSLWTRFGH